MDKFEIKVKYFFRKRRQKLFFIITFLSLAILGVGIVVNTIFFSSDLKEDSSNLVSFLIMEKDKAATPTIAAVLFLYYPENYFYLFELRTDVQLDGEKAEGRIGWQLKDLVAGKKKVEELLGIPINYTVTFSQETLIDLLSSIGGIRFFNLYSSKLSKGEALIDAFNYVSFLNGIENSYEYRDIFWSIWISGVNKILSISSLFKDMEWGQLKKVYNSLETDFKWNDFKKVTEVIMDKKKASIFESIFIKRALMNVEIQKKNGSILYYPLEQGSYDRNKIKAELSKMLELPAERFPIGVQVKNTTKINRLAVKTAGILQLHGIKVKEYLNDSVPLESSVLLNFSLSPLKMQHLMKVTKVSNVYPMFDHRREFDFSLYLAKDYYAIPFITNK